MSRKKNQFKEQHLILSDCVIQSNIASSNHSALKVFVDRRVFGGGNDSFKELPCLDGKFEIIYGFTFWEGVTSGLVRNIEDSSDEIYYFHSLRGMSDSSPEGHYFVSTLTKQQKTQILEYICLFETCCGTYCRYENGRMYSPEKEDYVSFFHSHNIDTLNQIIENYDMINVTYFMNKVKCNQIIGWLSHNGLFNLNKAKS